MKFEALATLTAVIATGSFARAAEKVNVTPSAVSLQIKQLEAYFRQPLFDRSARSARPTPFAIELSRTVERAMGEIEAMRLTPATVPAGRVRLGITESVLTTLLPRAFLELHQRFPQVELVVARGTTPGLLDQLKAAELDAAVVVRPPQGASSRLRWTPLMTEDFVLVVPQDLAGQPVAKVMRTQEWIRLDRKVFGGQLSAAFVQQVQPGKKALIELPGNDAVVAMVATGIGFSVLPPLRRELLEAYPVREIALGAGAPRRHLTLVRRAADADSRTLDAVEQAFLAAVSRSRRAG